METRSFPLKIMIDGYVFQIDTETISLNKDYVHSFFYFQFYLN